MKGKKPTLLLLFLTAVLIWGYAGYDLQKIFWSTPNIKLNTKIQLNGPYEVQKIDTLLLNYPDPFFKEISKTKLITKFHTNKAKAKIPQRPKFKFLGVFKSNGSKIALVKNQSTRMVKTGEDYFGYRIIKISDSILTLNDGLNDFDLRK